MCLESLVIGTSGVNSLESLVFSKLSKQKTPRVFLTKPMTPKALISKHIRVVAGLND